MQDKLAAYTLYNKLSIYFKDNFLYDDAGCKNLSGMVDVIIGFIYTNIYDTVSVYIVRGAAAIRLPRAFNFARTSRDGL